MKWKNQKSNGKGRESAPILPAGFFTVNGEEITILQGPFAGIIFQIGKIKVREDALTKQPQLLYDYKILNYAGRPPDAIETSKHLSRTIAAIALDTFADDIQSGIFEPNQ